MVSWKLLLGVLLLTVESWCAPPLLEALQPHLEDEAPRHVVRRVRVPEAVPQPLCTKPCDTPRAALGPLCAFDAQGKARTFDNFCALEAASCRDSTYYAIISVGEC